MPSEKKKQSIHAEIEYRKRLLEQQVLETAHYFDDHKDSLDEVMATWVYPQISQLDKLMKVVLKRAVPSNFLEIGAEKCHLGIRLVNSYNIPGICLDLSYDFLAKGAPVVAEKLKAKNLPARCVCDIHELPFSDGSFDLVLTFASLHHFYEPRVALSEIRRILAPGGRFICSEGFVPLLKAKKAVHHSEVTFGVLENRYTYLEYVSMFRACFSDVEMVFQDEQLMLHRIFEKNRVLGRVGSHIPKWLIKLYRICWTGAPFAIICQ